MSPLPFGLRSFQNILNEGASGVSLSLIFPWL
jgi:hypothetical protein